jgi:glycosyltransferase involved in cell wall biosynthesis
MKAALSGASKLLAPSQYFKDLFVSNGCPVNSVVVNKNGIRRPEVTSKIRNYGAVRFGYVGGNTEIKGVHLIRKVFVELNSHDIELVVVDNATNLGFSTYDFNSFEGVNRVKIVSAYNQDSIDEFFATIDVLLFPTQCKESFGLVVREALARNVWVISTDAGGAVEDIVAGKNGAVIPLSDDGTELKKAVLESISLFKKKDAGDNLLFSNNFINYYEYQSSHLAEIFIEENKIK